MELSELQTYDWREAFAFANPPVPTLNCRGWGRGPDMLGYVSDHSFTVDDVVEIIAASEGENDGQNWLMLGRLKDNRFFVVNSGCDFTGWDCLAGGIGYVSHTQEEAVWFGLGAVERERLGFPRVRALEP